MKTKQTISKASAVNLRNRLGKVLQGTLLSGGTFPIAMIFLAVFCLGPAIPLQAGEDLLQQFKSLDAATKRDYNALPQAPPSSPGAYAIEDVDGPIRTYQILVSRAMQESRIWAQHGSRLRSVLAGDAELAAYGEKTAQIYGQVSSLKKTEADILRQELAKSEALKALGPHTDINAWNNLVGQRNALDSHATSVINQETALLQRAFAGDDDIQNRLQKRQSRGQSDRLANGDSTTGDAFGTRRANPKLVPAEKGTIGSTKPGDQLKAAALEAKKGDKSDFRKNFDEGGAKSDGSLVAAHTLSAGPPPMDLSHFSERAKKDPQIVASLNNLSKLESKRMQVDKELNQLTAQRNAAKDPGKMKELTKKVDQENNVKQANLVEITNTTQEIENRHRKIDY